MQSAFYQDSTTDFVAKRINPLKQSGILASLAPFASLASLAFSYVL
ncbi:MAG: hypothetical protein VSS75_028380 [Candidatus Parabeggiatoa sp.]|nr:hypothetical protein [Candidatus Parabeggiatoa sp.]